MSKTESRFVDFRAVKAAVTMEQVLTHYGLTEKFKRGRDSLSGPCPIHQGSNPTQFRVCISKNCWNCFSDCHCGGNVLDFVAKMENVIPMEAANRLVEWFQLDVSALNVDANHVVAEVRNRSVRGQAAPDSRATDSTESGTETGDGHEQAALVSVGTRSGASLPDRAWTHARDGS